MDQSAALPVSDGSSRGGQAHSRRVFSMIRRRATNDASGEQSCALCSLPVVSPLSVGRRSPYAHGFWGGFVPVAWFVASSDQSNALSAGTGVTGWSLHLDADLERILGTLLTELAVARFLATTEAS